MKIFHGNITKVAMVSVTQSDAILYGQLCCEPNLKSQDIGKVTTNIAANRARKIIKRYETNACPD